MIKNEKLIKKNINKHWDNIQHMIDHNGRVLELRQKLYTRLVQLSGLPESDYIKSKVIEIQTELDKQKEYTTTKFLKTLDMINEGNRKL